MGRQQLLLALALLFLLGLGATIVRLLEARRTGLSLRLQVFILLAATTLLLSAMSAGIVIDRFTARASLFATRAAEDEARAIAELAARTPGDSLRPILQAFTRSAIDSDVALLDGEGRVVLESGEAHLDVARVSAEAPVASGGGGGGRQGALGGGQAMWGGASRCGPSRAPTSGSSSRRPCSRGRGGRRGASSRRTSRSTCARSRGKWWTRSRPPLPPATCAWS